MSERVVKIDLDANTGDEDTEEECDEDIKPKSMSSNDNQNLRSSYVKTPEASAQSSTTRSLRSSRKTNASEEKNTSGETQHEPKTKDASTDPMLPIFNTKDINWTTGLVSKPWMTEEWSLEDLKGVETKKCYRCSQCNANRLNEWLKPKSSQTKSKTRFKSKSELIDHNRRHHKSEVLFRYIKYRKVCKSKFSKEETKSTSGGPKTRSSQQKSSRRRKSKTKMKIKSEPKYAIPSKLNTSSMPVNSDLNYKLLPKCLICSFIPLIDSKRSIESHIRSEHKFMIDKDITDLYKQVMIKTRKTALI